MYKTSFMRNKQSAQALDPEQNILHSVNKNSAYRQVIISIDIEK